MTPKELAHHGEALKRAREALLATGPARIEPNRTDAVSVGVADEDAQALSEMMKTLSSQRNRKQGELLAQIERALRRIAETPEEYGLCEECEEEIGDKRLAVMPHATLCTTCQSKRDPRRGVGRRSTTDYR